MKKRFVGRLLSFMGVIPRKDLLLDVSPMYGDLIAIMLTVAVRDPDGVKLLRSAIDAVETSLRDELTGDLKLATVH